VSLRVGASAAAADSPALTEPRGGDTTIAVHKLFDAGDWIDCRHVPAAAIAADTDLAGPAIVSGATATTYIPKGWTAARDAGDNLIMRRN